MPNIRNLTVRSAKKWIRAFWEGAFIQNPVLVGGMGLYLVLAGSSNLTGALLLSLLVVFLTIPVCVICWLAGKWIPTWLRLPLAFLLTSVLYLPVYTHMQALYMQPMQAIGLCGIVVSADSLLLVRAFSPEKRPLSMVLVEALGGAVGFVVVLLLLAGMWSLLGNLKETANFAHARVPLGLIAIAFLAALWRFFEANHRNRSPKRRKLQ